MPPPQPHQEGCTLDLGQLLPKCLQQAKELFPDQTHPSPPQHLEPLCYCHRCRKVCIWQCPPTNRFQWGLHPCSYLSQLFGPAKWNYNIYDWELLTIMASRPGATICKGTLPWYRSSQTMKTSLSSNKHKSSIEGKPDGCWTLLTMTSSSFTYLEASSVCLMPSPNDPILSLKLMMTTKGHPPSSPPVC